MTNLQQPSINLQRNASALFIDAAVVPSPAVVPAGTTALALAPAGPYAIDLQDANSGVEAGDLIAIDNQGAGVVTVNQNALGVGSVAAGGTALFAAAVDAAGNLVWAQIV